MEPAIVAQDRLLVTVRPSFERGFLVSISQKGSKPRFVNSLDAISDAVRLQRTLTREKAEINSKSSHASMVSSQFLAEDLNLLQYWIVEITLWSLYTRCRCSSCVFAIAPARVISLRVSEVTMFQFQYFVKY